VRRRVTRALDHIGHRGSSLLAFAFIDYVYGIALVTAPAGVIETNATYRWFDGIMPLCVWSIFWLAVAVNCTVHAFLHDDRFGFVGAIGIKVVWAIGSLAGCILSDVSIAGPGLWVGLMFMVWRIAGWAEPGVMVKDHES
jgi:hypothetical protein